jgi:N-acetylmuramoyl-L-alanine amidase
MRQWRGIVIHHSETADNGTLLDLEAIRQYHIKHNGWQDIGYHYVIEKVGGVYRVFAGRSIETDGAHALGFNTSHIGICCVGNFDLDSPSQELYDCLSNLIGFLKNTYGIKDNNIIGHRDTYVLRGVPVEKSCPGKKYEMNKIAEL